MSVAGGRISAGAGSNLLGAHAQDRNTEATCYVGNLEPQVNEELLWEIFVQAGPVVNVYMPKDRVTNAHQGYAFVEFRGEQDAEYVSETHRERETERESVRANERELDVIVVCGTDSLAPQ